MAASEQAPIVESSVTLSRYFKRVILKTLLGRSDGGLGLVGERIVIGGWVKSSEEERKEAVPTMDVGGGTGGPKDVDCVEILQSRIPLFRSIVKVFGGRHYPIREKSDSVTHKLPQPPPPSTAILQISDGSCVANLQVNVDSSIESPSQVMPTGTCILVEGTLQQPLMQGKHDIELKAEKIIHIGIVEQDKYPLSKNVPFEILRDCSQFRPRTTTMASIMRIRNAMTQATHTFFQNHGFLYVQLPIITTMASEGFSKKFQVTNLFGKETEGEQNAMDETGGASLEFVKAFIEEKSKQVDELKRNESNKEALVAALQDLSRTNELALQLEAREKSKSRALPKTDKGAFSENLFSSCSYLMVSGWLHLESFACALGNVYSFGPRFRAQKSESKKCVAEMWMIELEMAFSQLEDAMNCADDLLKFLCKWVLENCSEDLMFVSKLIDKTIVDRLQSMTSSSFEKISYEEAVEVLKQATDKKFEAKLEWGVSLTEEHESYLADEIYKRPVIIYNYPKEVEPFYVRLNEDGKTVAAFDVIAPKAGTLIRGSQNEERLDMIKELSLRKTQYEWYLDLHRHGTVKHSGFSFVFDLMVFYATGLTDVRDVIPFPRSCSNANN